MSRLIRKTFNGVRWHTEGDFLPQIENGPFRDMDAVFAGSRVIKDLAMKKLVEFTVGEDTYIIKLYREPGLKLGLKRVLRGSKALQEMTRCRDVMRRGMPTVPIAAVGEMAGESFLVAEKLMKWTSLEEILLSAEVENAEKRNLLFEFGRFSRQVHDAGVHQDDFNPGNLLVKSWGERIEFKLIDFERVTLHASLSEAKRLRLVCKLCRLQSVGRAKLLIFMDGYLHKYPEDQRREREILEILNGFVEELADKDRVRTQQRCVEENRNFGRLEVDSFKGFYRKIRMDSKRRGISREQAESLHRNGSGDFIRRVHDQAVYEWKQANLRAEDGGPVPFAVLYQKRGNRGFIGYRREDIQDRGLDWQDEQL